MVHDIIARMAATVDDRQAQATARRLVERSYKAQIKFWVIANILSQFGLLDLEREIMFHTEDKFKIETEGKVETFKITRTPLRTALIELFDHQNFFDVAGSLGVINAE
jgi:hypothetical protein